VTNSRGYHIEALCRARKGDGLPNSDHGPMSAMGLVSRASPVHTAVRNCTRDEGGPFEVGNHGLISSRCKLLRSKAVVVSVAVKLGPKVQDGKVERDERKRTVDEVSKSD
jgi:hypothetical protein